MALFLGRLLFIAFSNIAQQFKVNPLFYRRYDVLQSFKSKKKSQFCMNKNLSRRLAL